MLIGFFRYHCLDKGPIKASSAVTDASPTNSEFKEQDIVFVAGATGKVGSRTVRLVSSCFFLNSQEFFLAMLVSYHCHLSSRELLKLGFRVRAGVRSAQRAKGLVQV